MPKRDPEPPPRGPWSDLPPAPTQRGWRLPWPVQGTRRGREPIINNWRGLLIVLFLLFLAPVLASWAAHYIMGLMSGG